jgi:hypothetical protein
MSTTKEQVEKRAMALMGIGPNALKVLKITIPQDVALEATCEILDAIKAENAELRRRVEAIEKIANTRITLPNGSEIVDCMAGQPVCFTARSKAAATAQDGARLITPGLPFQNVKA